MTQIQLRLPFHNHLHLISLRANSLALRPVLGAQCSSRDGFSQLFFFFFKEAGIVRAEQALDIFSAAFLATPASLFQRFGRSDRHLGDSHLCIHVMRSLLVRSFHLPVKAAA